MKRIITLLGVVLLIAFIAWSCERDDICAEGTATTPLLIIRFYDVNNQDNTKEVRQLEVKGLGDDGLPFSETPIVSRTNTDSIALPLRFTEEGIETITRFQLERDADFADNTDPNDDSNIDIITVTYTPEFIYVSRACGYKSIFNFGATGGVTREVDGDDDIWITNIEIVNETIDNENAAQVILYH
ncbi:DUF6452 family protein [uncultured Psychroserpens sp.]|uniref:DUF6452 family protein n=1 Tax=uncultured Psychroserpens sp. TaxID=255436 RepID=UPI002628ABE3|nr:DUF6452 family protein [uncultured Psychroserpens sp.]